MYKKGGGGGGKDGAGNGCLDTFNGCGISLKEIAMPDLGDAYSSFGCRKYKYSCAVVAGRSSFDIHLRSPVRGAAVREI